MTSPKVLIVIAGPTAIGKTSLAIRVAQHFNTEIISADSRQFYREMSIGTAKPTSAELGAVRHHFINSHSVTEEFSVGDFEAQGLVLLNSLYETHDVVVMAGGSGLYIDAICEGFDELPKPAPGVREELNEKLKAHGLAPLTQELMAVDPVYFGQVDLQNPQRIIRALEVWRSTGKPISSFRKREVKQRPFHMISIGLTAPREVIYERINTRVDSMISEGLVDEVKSLLPYRELNALNTVGYSEIFEFLDETISLDRAVEMVKQNTRRFAKRQLTWFRRKPAFNWFDPSDDALIFHYITDKINELTGD